MSHKHLRLNILKGKLFIFLLKSQCSWSWYMAPLLTKGKLRKAHSTPVHPWVLSVMPSEFHLNSPVFLFLWFRPPSGSDSCKNLPSQTPYCCFWPYAIHAPPSYKYYSLKLKSDYSTALAKTSQWLSTALRIKSKLPSLGVRGTAQWWISSARGPEFNPRYLH